MNTDFEIRIASKLAAIDEIMRNRHKWHVLSIRDPEDKKAPIDVFKNLCKSILPLKFHDIRDEHEGAVDNHGNPLVLPEVNDVKNALEWSIGKDRILVHCEAGISRSSAMAYLIACTRMSAKKATTILNFHLHWPNPRIVRIGSEVMNRADVLAVLEEWRKAGRTEPKIKATFT